MSDKKSNKSVVPAARIEGAIFLIRNEKVMLDEDLARKLSAMERQYDKQFKTVFDALRQLMAPQKVEKRPIGFKVATDDEKK